MRNTVFKLAIKSIRYRRSTIFLSIFSIALSVMLLLGIERIRAKVEESFTSTISGTDLIVGARTGNISLLLSTVFHIGNASQNVSWESYQKISRLPQVDWTIPIALGDSHKGYSVVGTTPEFFAHFKYSADLLLSTQSGETNISNMYCVIGSQVAKKLGYAVNDPIVLTHGMGSEDFLTHVDNPFEISGVLAPTGTPIDNSILISLNSLDQIHEEFYQYDKKNVNVFGDFNYQRNRPDNSAQNQEKPEEQTKEEDHDHEHDEDHHHGDEGEHNHEGHDHDHGDDYDQENHTNHDHSAHDHGHDHDHGEPGSITGFFLGVKNKSDILGLQRTINEEKDEALLAILPVVTLLELWNIINPIEKILLIISLLVLIVSLGSVLTAIISSLNQRRREMSVLRSVGAHPGYIFGLIIIESTGIVITGIVTGIILLLIALVITKPILVQNFGMILEIGKFTQGELLILVAIFVAGILVGLIPAISSYRRTLSDGLTIKI